MEMQIRTRWNLFAAEPQKTRYLIVSSVKASVPSSHVQYCLEMVITTGHPCSQLQTQLTIINQPIPRTTIGEIKTMLYKLQQLVFLLSTKPVTTASWVRDCSRISSRKGWVFSWLILVLWEKLDERKTLDELLKIWYIYICVGLCNYQHFLGHLIHKDKHSGKNVLHMPFNKWFVML